jgi:serine/threonine protein kinase
MQSPVIDSENKLDCLPPSIADLVSQRIESTVSAYLESSRFIKPQMCKTLPQFDRDELILGKLMGSGGFSQVFEVMAFCPSCEASDCLTLDQQDARKKISNQSRRRSKGKNPFVVKHIQSKFLVDTKRFKDAAIDLVVEANFLASIKHPNILSIKGWALGGSLAYSGGKHDGFFIVLDRLEETLDQRIRNWSQQLKRYKQPSLEKIAKEGKIQRLLFAGRLNIARDIASAIAYLHENGIIYRDLKPANIGFDVDGNVKLFDFGLSREMPEEAIDMDDKYEMSGRVGTVRYMCPEVCKSESYNQRADCYSLAMVVWEMFALEKPFQSFTKSMHRQLVVELGERPRLDSEWPCGVQALLHFAWSDDMSIRPSMKQFHSTIVQELSDLQGSSEVACGVELMVAQSKLCRRTEDRGKSKVASSVRSVDTADTCITLSGSDPSIHSYLSFVEPID